MYVFAQSSLDLTGKRPTVIGSNSYYCDPDLEYCNQKIYVGNKYSNSISVINGSTINNSRYDIPVGDYPLRIAEDTATNMVYVANFQSHTVSVIDGFSDKVAAGVTLNIHPGDEGKIVCDHKEVPTNTYFYIDVGANCKAESKDFQFTGWVENVTPNSTTSLLDSSGNLTVNRYGTFTANFKPTSTRNSTRVFVSIIWHYCPVL